MGDEDNRREFIDSNSYLLTKSTVIGIELVINLFSKKLINDEEKDLLSNQFTPNMTRAAILYTTIANRWSQTQFEEFKAVLRETGNSMALQIFTNAGADVFLTNEQVRQLRAQRDKGDSGCYEGISYEDEVAANRLVQIVLGDGMFREDGEFVLSGVLERKEVVPLTKTFAENLKNEVIWWNPSKESLPSNYISRSVARTCDIDSDGSLYYREQRKTLIEITQERRLVLLVDPPGMGKSSEMTQLDLKLRSTLRRNRVIVRVNLNEVQKALKTIKRGESSSSVLLKLALFLPPEALQVPRVSVFVLLDGLDEVCATHQETMLNLLRILTTSNEEMEAMRHFHVVVTTRPHLRGAVKKEFNTESWSLLPLTREEQDEYMSSVGVLCEQLSAIRGKLTPSVSDLLSNPLMLSMLMEVLRCKGQFLSVDGVNIFDLYTRFVASKHELQLVEKGGMEVGANLTNMLKGSSLRSSLPFYYQVACQGLMKDDITHSPAFSEWLGRLVVEPSPDTITGNTPNDRSELLSVGLLTEGRENQLLFKHRSFGEFFYANLLTSEKPILPQRVRDVLFGNIYAGRHVLGNVEDFVGASAVSLARRHAPGGKSDAFLTLPSLLFPLTYHWLSVGKDLNASCEVLCNFVESGKLFPLLVKEVLMSFVHGGPTELWESHKVLLNKSSKEAFTQFFQWMIENREWTRGELFKVNQVTRITTITDLSCSMAAVRLMVAIGVKDEHHAVLSEEQVGMAVNSVDRLAFIVAKVHTEGKGRYKWDFVEGLLCGGRNQLTELFLQMNDEDLFLIIDDLETAWKLVEILDQKEIFALVTDEETRVTDILGDRAREVIFALGEEFVPRLKLAEFRGKFGVNQGKTVFEMEDGCDFALEHLWKDLLGEVDRDDSSGPVGMALREAFGRMQAKSTLKLLEKMERQVKRMRVWSGGRQQEEQRSKEKEQPFVGGNEKALRLQGVMNWVTRGVQWDRTFCPYSFRLVPFFLRYCENVDPTDLTTLLTSTSDIYMTSVLELLRSLVVVSSLRSHNESDTWLFTHLASFLRINLTQVHALFQSLVRIFLGATREQIRAAASSSSSLYLVRDICLGMVALNLIQQQHATIVQKTNTWDIIACDVISFVSCCGIPEVFQQLRLLWEDKSTNDPLEEDFTDLSLEGFKVLLTSLSFLRICTKRLNSWKQTKVENSHQCVMCGVSHLLSFYFSVFGLNLEWMEIEYGNKVEAKIWVLVSKFAVEISKAFRGNPQWSHLVPPFREMLKEHLRETGVNSVDAVVKDFFYISEEDWEAFLNLIDGETLLSGKPEYDDISNAVAAPLLRVFIKLYGLEWTKDRVTPEVWNKIPSALSTRVSSVAALGSLLHSAVELGELKEVRRRAWPGILSWRNAEGKTALEVATEIHDNLHPIRIHLEKLTLSHKHLNFIRRHPK